MAKTSHNRYVDRRLSVARQQLSLADSHQQSSHSIECSAAVDSAMLQTYFSVIHYFNELLDAYDEPVLSFDRAGFNGVLDEQFFERLTSIPQFVEWKQLFCNKNSWFSILLTYPQQMVDLGSLEGNSSHLSNRHKDADRRGLHHDIGKPLWSKTQKPASLIAVSDIYVEEYHEGKSANNAVNVSELSIADMNWIVNECAQLIHQQRDQLVEY